MNKEMLLDKIYGSLIGGLIGDAMGAPTENKTWQEIQEMFGTVTDFSGSGTDDSAIKQILCETILASDGHITCDEFAASFLQNKKYYRLFFVPVKNMFHRLTSKLEKPVNCGYANALSSSSAMSISPMGIINACNPRQASIEAYEVAGLIHSGPSSFCRDAAASMAAAVAEAFKPDATVDSVIVASIAYLHQDSASEMIEAITKAIDGAKEIGTYEDFRSWFYENCLSDVIPCDSRETIPCALALFYLAGGDLEKTVIYAANFGRDTDTIGTMAGAIAGALNGASGIRSDWVKKIEEAGNTVQEVSGSHYGPNPDPVVLPDQHELAEKLLEVIRKRHMQERVIYETLEAALSESV